MEDRNISNAAEMPRNIPGKHDDTDYGKDELDSYKGDLNGIEDDFSP